MPVIELRFPAGRLHATPWGRHVNEGAVEWPPSPWRLLRAFIATWYLKARDDISETTMSGLIHSLAEHLPSFELPPASLGHTRHYMPIIKGKNQKPTKVFDAFICVHGPVLVRWDSTLMPEQRRALALLCERLGYFGRAEAVVEARLLPNDATIQPNAAPLVENQPLPQDCELAQVLCAQSAESFAEWRTKQNATEALSAEEKRKSARKTSKLTVAQRLPVDLFAALHADTGELQADGWTLPPGSQFVDYGRPTRCFDTSPSGTRKKFGPLPTVARFAVSSAVLPRITRAVSVTERMHQALVKYSDQAPVFTGTDANRKPLTGHRHAQLLCETNGPCDAITHVTVFAPMGFDKHARLALEELARRGVWGHGGHDLQLVLLGVGDKGTFPDAAALGYRKPHMVWRSLTPFVSTRHPKTHRDGRPKLDTDGWPIGSPEHDLRRLIREAGLPLPTALRVLPIVEVGTRRVRAIEFQNSRYHGEGLRGYHGGYFFELTFPDPIPGPLAFGYGAHFGLGLFVPV